MKALYTSALLLSALGSQAQVIFDLPGSIPPFSSVERETWWQLDGAPALVISGQGVTWNLSGLTPAPFNAQATIADPATTPWGSSFPNSTHAAGNLVDGGGWSYYTLANDSLFIDGGEFAGDVFSCSEPRLAAVFPFSYAQSLSASSTCQFPGGFPPFTQDAGAEIVATGTIIYPGGTINNVVMVRRWLGISPSEYLWYTMDNALLDIGNYSPDAEQIVLHVPDAVSAIGAADHADLLLAFPVPATDVVVIALPRGTGATRYEVLDATGAVMDQGQALITDGQLRLGVSAWPAGQYIVLLSRDEKLWRARVSVAR